MKTGSLTRTFEAINYYYKMILVYVVYLLPHFDLGRDYSNVDGRSKRKCYWTRASYDCGRLQIGDVTRAVEFLSNDYTNHNTNPKTLTTLALTLADHHDAFEAFVRRYFVTLYGTIPEPSTVQ